jgi:hypothetical protein
MGAEVLTDHATRLLAARKLDASPANLAYARRRVMRAGRLAELGAHLVPCVLAVETVETGEPDHMAEGSMFARVVLDAPEHTWGAEAAALDAGLRERAAERGLELMLAVDRATPRDRRRERLRWAFRWPR